MLLSGSQIDKFQRSSWNKTKPILFFGIFLSIVCMKCARIGDSPLFISAISGRGGDFHALEIPFQQATGTETPSPTSSITQTITLTATATLIPFPAIHLDLPSSTPTSSLNYLEHLDGSPNIAKGKGSFFNRMIQYWFLILIVAIWGIVGVWYVIVQVLDRRGR